MESRSPDLQSIVPCSYLSWRLTVEQRLGREEGTRVVVTTAHSATSDICEALFFTLHPHGGLSPFLAPPVSLFYTHSLSFPVP